MVHFSSFDKKADRLVGLSPHINWSKNIWMGVSIKNKAVLDRYKTLKQCEVHTKIVSAESLLEAIGTINLEGIDLLIVDGESGAGCRPFKKERVIELCDLTITNHTAFFFNNGAVSITVRLKVNWAGSYIKVSSTIN